MRLIPAHFVCVMYVFVCCVVLYRRDIPLHCGAHQRGARGPPGGGAITQAVRCAVPKWVCTPVFDCRRAEAEWLVGTAQRCCCRKTDESCQVHHLWLGGGRGCTEDWGILRKSQGPEQVCLNICDWHSPPHLLFVSVCVYVCVCVCACVCVCLASLGCGALGLTQIVSG